MNLLLAIGLYSMSSAVVLRSILPLVKDNNKIIYILYIFFVITSAASVIIGWFDIADIGDFPYPNAAAYIPSIALISFGVAIALFERVRRL